MEFPWNKKSKDPHHSKGSLTRKSNGETTERQPYTLEEVEELLQKYNKKKIQRNGKSLLNTNGKNGQTVHFKPKTDFKPQVEDLNTVSTPKPAESVDEPLQSQNLTPSQTEPVPEKEESQTSLLEDITDYSGSYPAIDEFIHWLQKELKDALVAVFISDLEGKKVYGKEGLDTERLKPLISIPPVVDNELQQDLHQGRVLESLFRMENRKMLYYLDIEDIRIGMLLDESQLNMGILFGVLKPAIVKRGKSIRLI